MNKLLGVSVIVPCFNEEASLDQLFEKLTAVRSMFSDKFDLEFILVDDGSSDATAAGIEKRSRSGSFVKTFSHARNRGIAAAIMTGIREASNELVATIDADCTYDPIQLGGLIEKMEDGVAMVTASPYHPLGEVEGIPGWRLGLSRACSLVYRKLVKTQIHTYTSCFRLHRRSMVLGISLREEGFVGVAEMLWHVSRRGGVIEEVPVRLTGRRVGYSKMRTLPVIFAHLKLMTRIAVDRCLHP
ncbi:MAG: glycosyltransferase family 2 protein [Pirellulaceae bacterium]|nr:glycosyltransferase family 2 protein [Pirellulaceae bacterium]